jgi:hypothetical protein
VSATAIVRAVRVCVALALVVCAARDAQAQTQLNQNCIVSVLNRNTQVNADGSWVLPNVPAGFGLVRARASCLVDGKTVTGESDLFTVPPNGVVNLKPITFGQTTPIPLSITLTAATQTLTQAGALLPLEAFAIYPDGTTRNVSAASTGTQYTVSNQTIATVSGDGQLQALTSGTVIVQATLEGASGLLSIHVVLSNRDTDGDGIPDDYELAHGLNPNNPLDAQEDPDRDGLTNLQEFQLGTDPHNPDTDGDGLSDGDEVNLYHTNPLLADTDGDGIPDGVEVQTHTNPLDRNAFDLRAATLSSIVTPATFVLRTSGLFSSASQLLNWKVTLIDGKTALDLTADPLTSYSSTDLSVCNFGLEKGRIFAGSPGNCTITLTNNTLSATASGSVQSFTPAALSFLNIPGFANSVAVNGNFAYVAAGSAGLQIVDVSNRATPHIVASQALPGNANDVVVVGSLAYVAAGTAGLQIVNVQNPFGPTVSGSVSTGGAAWDVVVKGNFAYVANGANGLVIVDVSSPTAPWVASTLPLAGTTKGVDVDPARGIAVVARGTIGISVLKVTVPYAVPTVLATLTGGDVRDVAIAGNFAFLADFSRSFTSVDITNPAAPVKQASTPASTGGLLQDVAINGSVAAGADVFFVNGVPLVDVSNPATPQPRAILDFSSLRDDNGTGIAMDASFVYLTAEAGTISENGVTGTTRLYIGQYQKVDDTAGVPPTIRITSPAAGGTVLQGSTFTVTADATDDFGVAAVNFFVNGQLALTTTSPPYKFTLTALAVNGIPPSGLLTLGATAVDFAGNAASAPNVTLNWVYDRFTTVVGRFVDTNGAPLSNLVASVFGANNWSAASGTDGRFSIVSVPSIYGNVVVSVNNNIFTTRGPYAGTSGSFAPVPGGTTNVGDIVAVSLGGGAQVPPGTEQAATNTSLCIPFTGFLSGNTTHYQQVYTASAFSKLTLISHLSFFSIVSHPIGTTALVPGTYQVSFSTTAKPVNGLSTDLASNVGPDNTVSFTGTLAGVTTGQNGWFTITATQPFLYDPHQGNLLMDVTVTSSAPVQCGTFGAASLDANSTGVSTSSAFSAGSGLPQASPVGLVTWFNFP